VPATPFVSRVNLATSEILRLQAAQEGLVPVKNWVKSALDRVIQVCMGERDLESGNIFQSGSRVIERMDDRLTLVCRE
jgi:hypothetical protein